MAGAEYTAGHLTGSATDQQMMTVQNVHGTAHTETSVGHGLCIS